MDRPGLAAELEALHPQCFGWALACCDYSREEAEDTLHDAYVKVLDGHLRFDGRSTLRTWLFGVIRRSAHGRRRRDRIRFLLWRRNTDRIDGPSPAEPPDEYVEHAERRQRARQALGRLARRQREVLMLVFYHELTVDDTAAVLGISVGAARVHYQRGKERLRSLLAREET